MTDKIPGRRLLYLLSERGMVVVAKKDVDSRAVKEVARTGRNVGGEEGREDAKFEELDGYIVGDVFV